MSGVFCFYIFSMWVTKQLLCPVDFHSRGGRKKSMHRDSFSNDSESILKDSESILCSSQITSVHWKHMLALYVCCRIHFF